MKSKRIITSALVTLSMLSGVFLSINNPIKETNALTHNNGYPYFELGETTYVNGANNAVFSNGIMLESVGDVGTGVYVYISNLNFYNSTTTNSYTTLDTSLVFINVVFYDVYTNGSVGFSFVLRNDLGAALSINEWQSVRNLTLLINQYQSTSYFVISYQYVFRLFGNGQSTNVSRDTGITDVNNYHTSWSGGLPASISPTGLKQTIQFKTYGYTQGDLDDAYQNGIVNGNSVATSSAYNSGYQAGLSVNNSQLYEEAYQKGANESFLSGIQKWIVPAIIIVIIVGGATAFIQMKRKEN